MNTKVIEKIKNLLDLSKSDNMYEAETALKKAQLIANKEGIELDDVLGYSENKKEVEDSIFDIKQKSVPFWIGSLAVVVAENFKTVAYQVTRGTGSQLVIMGLKEDVTMTKYVLQYTIECFEKMFALYHKEHPTGTRSESIKQRNDYHLGFLRGIREAFAENVKEYGLVLVKDDLVVQRQEELGLKKRQSKTVRSFDMDAIEAGKRDGKSISQRDRVTEKVS